MLTAHFSTFGCPIAQATAPQPKELKSPYPSSLLSLGLSLKKMKKKVIFIFILKKTPHLKTL